MPWQLTLSNLLVMKLIQTQTKKRSKEVTTENIDELAKEMIELCKKPLGGKPSAVAIAHCQIDHDNPLRFFVTSSGSVYVNPKILEKTGEFWHKEGCMTHAFRPNKKVRRAERVTVEYQDLNGDKHEEEFTGLMACVFQHEIDHMNGKSIYS